MHTPLYLQWPLLPTSGLLPKKVPGNCYTCSTVCLILSSFFYWGFRLLVQDPVQILAHAHWSLHVSSLFTCRSHPAWKWGHNHSNFFNGLWTSNLKPQYLAFCEGLGMTVPLGKIWEWPLIHISGKPRQIHPHSDLPINTTSTVEPIHHY